MNNIKQFEDMTIKELRELTEQYEALQKEIGCLTWKTKKNMEKSLKMAENLNMEHYIDEINRKEEGK